MKYALTFVLLLTWGTAQIPAAELRDFPAKPKVESEQTEQAIALVTQHLSKLTALLKQSRAKKPKAMRAQLRKIDQYFESSEAKRAHRLILDGFPFPEEEEMTATLSEKAKLALRTLEKFRKATAAFLDHCDRHFTACDRLGQDAATDAINDVMEMAMYGYLHLYTILHQDIAELPEWEEYRPAQ